MTLHWVPGHVGVEGTEKAEEFARKGASTLLVGIALLWPWSCFFQGENENVHSTQEV